MYIGRFAPSPTGLLHIGSLLTAVASYADARSRGGKWLVRMEDLDPPREMAGAAEHILRTLEAFGFEWDGAVAYQSRRYAIYEAALGRLKDEGLVYPCYCSRKDWQAAASAGADGFVYSGRCRNPADRPSETGKQPHGASACPTKPSVSMMKSSDIMRRIWRATSAISYCCGRTAIGHTSLPWSPTTPNRA